LGGLSPRVALLFTLLALLEVLCVCLALEAEPSEPLSLLFPILAISPFLALAVLISPVVVLLATPLLIIIPGTIMGFAPFELVFLAACTGAAMRGGAAGSLPEPLEWMEIVFGLYVIWAAITVSQAAELRHAMEGLKQITMSFLFFLAGARVLGRGAARSLLHSLCLLLILIALQMAVVIHVKGFSMDLLLTRILALTDLGWGRANYVAAISALASCGAIALALFGRGWERALGIVGIVSALFVQVVTMSRGGAVALLGGLLLAAALEARRRLIPALALALAMLAAIVLTPMGQALVSRFADRGGIQSVGVRFLYYAETWRIARSHLFLGVGPDQIPYHSSYFVDKNPHNFLLKNLADLGVVGLLLFLALFLMAARRALQSRRAVQTEEDRILSLSLVLALGVGLVNALYEPTLTGASYSLAFWLLIGALTAPARRRTG